jgi:VWFA-related protein
MAEAGMAIDPRWLAAGPPTEEGGRRAMEWVLRATHGAPPTAFFVASLMSAIGALAALSAAGLVVPADVSLVTFNDHPNLTVKFTNDLPALASGLAGLKAERGTALYDSIIFTLYYFTGVKGQRAMLLLTDGKDEGSRFTYEDALEYARRAGVTIYAIGLGDDADRKKLERISEETGGRAFFLKSVDELAGIYSTIESELRSQYLVAYQSTNTTSGSNTFRSIDVKVNKPGLEPKTIRGYYP